MFRGSIQQRLQAALDDWRDRDLIDGTIHHRLTNDVSVRHRSGSFATVVALLGAVLLSAAVVAFVASNWEEMSRLARLALLIGGLWAAYAGAFEMHRRGRTGLRETLLIVATAIFGGTIMLIGQMFHLQGDVRDALLMWFIGTVALTAASRSVPVLVCASLISVAWLATVGWSWTGLGHSKSDIYWYPALWLICVVLAVWLKSRFAAHVLAMAMCVWQLVLLIEHAESPAQVFWLLFSANFILAAVLLYSREIWRLLAGFEEAALVYTFLVLNGLAIILMAILLGEPHRTEITPVSALVWPSLALVTTAGLALAASRRIPNALRDHWVIAIASGLAVVLLAIAALAGSGPKPIHVGLLSALYAFFLAIWTVRFGWRLDFGAMSGVGYVAFIVTLFATYSVLFGSLQMTAAVYGLGGVALVGFSIWLARRERTPQANVPEGDAS